MHFLHLRLSSNSFSPIFLNANNVNSDWIVFWTSVSTGTTSTRTCCSRSQQHLRQFSLWSRRCSDKKNPLTFCVFPARQHYLLKDRSSLKLGDPAGFHDLPLHTVWVKLCQYPPCSHSQPQCCGLHSSNSWGIVCILSSSPGPLGSAGSDPRTRAEGDETG